MATRKSGFTSRPAEFAVGAHLVWASQGWSCLVRVEAHEGDKAKARVVRSGGAVSFSMKPSSSTRAVMTADDAARVMTMLATPPPVVGEREERLKRGQAAQKSVDPFVKAEALAELALLRAGGTGFWSDDKVLYGRLKEQVADELALSLALSVDEVEQRLAALGIG